MKRVWRAVVSSPLASVHPEDPARVILALLSPPRQREAHLRTLDRQSRRLRKGARPEALAGADTVEGVARWFPEAGG